MSVRRWTFGKHQLTGEYDDIKKMKLPKNFAKYFHIGGERKDLNSPWTYQDGTGITFLRCANNEPSNTSRSLCLYIETIPMAMHDGECRQSYPYLCEVTV